VNRSGVPHEPPRIPVFRQGRTSRLPQQPDPTPRWPQSCVAPFSWMVARDVEQGREALNFSTGDEDDGEADDAAEVVADAEMPPRRYLLVHPGAALSDADRQVLVEALEAMDRNRGGDRSGPGGGDGDEDRSGPGGGG
jgi:hypothetical protein